MKNFKKKIAPFIPAIIVFFGIIFVFLFILLLSGVPSGSMEPTIPGGSFIISNRLSAFFGDPERGDIVVFYSEEYGYDMVKRVIGIEGDKITIKEGKVYINDEEENGFYINGQTLPNQVTEYIVPEGYVFVLGDNREESKDSRYFKEPFIKESDIKGYVFINFSLGSAGWFFHFI